MIHGHGGSDVGAISSYNGLYEKNINLKVAKNLKKYLEEYEDVNIVMTREDDTFSEIFDRSILARNAKVDILISLHMNSSTSQSVNGAEVYVTNNTTLPKYKEETSKLASEILKSLNKLGIANRGVLTRLIPKDETDIYTDGTRADYYGIIRYAMRGCKIDSGVIKPAGAVPANVQNGEGTPAIIVEHCYLSSDRDYKYFNTDEAILNLARADAEAIANYYHLRKEEYNKFKIKDNLIIAEPNITLDKIKEKYSSAKMETSEMKTGATIDIEQKVYYLIKLGDSNGDSRISPADYVKIKNHIMEVSNLEEYNLVSADVNEDGKISPADYVIIKNYIMETGNIKIKEE